MRAGAIGARLANAAPRRRCAARRRERVAIDVQLVAAISVAVERANERERERVIRKFRAEWETHKHEPHGELFVDRTTHQ
ncbi:hypothetical protein KDW10_30495 [Burkholderia vietnamiensis]|uniref:hypothetical protein n=1 Tax=Burkholderia vietnamiensis TaxID=60552 RepID=UPI001B9E357C|nr:hypothetical protein [Burkholderia vietnamiensis]MBR8361661.1 hypothetical protein [Burkholderia vietnamiensis]